MAGKKKLLHSLALNVWGILFAAGLGVAFVIFPIGDNLRYLSYDLLFIFKTEPPPDDLIIVHIDEASHAALNQPYDMTWDRSLHAELLDTLTDQGASLVLYDIVFELPSSNEKSDIAFADAIRRNGKVILGASLGRVYGTYSTQAKIIGPTPLFRKAALDWGLLEVDPIEPRRIITGIPDRKSVTWEAAAHLKPGFEKTAGPRLAERWLNYLGPPNHFPSISFHQAHADKGIADDFFKDKVVFIGSKYQTGFSGSGKDTFTTPYSIQGSGLASGVEIHATAFHNLKEGNWLVRLKTPWEVLAVGLYGIFLAAFLGNLQPRTGLIAGCICFLGVTAFSVLTAWETLTFYSWLVPVCIQTPTVLIWAVGTQYYVENRRKKLLKNAFSAYLSPTMAEQISERDFDLSPGGSIRDVTIMFTDLEGFTKLSEHSNPQEITHILNTYFNYTTVPILNTGGTILKFIGDAVLAVWGAPLDDEDQADHAVEAALDVIDSTHGKKVYGHPLRTRIGINSGKDLVGNLGSNFRFDYTVIGDNTNMASRLEGLNKFTGTDILITETTQKMLSAKFNLRLAGKFVMVGKREAVKIYEVLSRNKSEKPDLEWRAIFSEALDLFCSKKFSESEALFHKVISLRPEGDGLSSFYLKEIGNLMKKDQISEHWKGEITLTSK